MKTCKKCQRRAACIDSRVDPRGNTRRRYECKCGDRYSTIEIEIDSYKHHRPENSIDISVIENAISEFKDKIYSAGVK